MKNILRISGFLCIILLAKPGIEYYNADTTTPGNDSSPMTHVPIQKNQAPSMEDIDVLTYGLENSEYSEAEMRLDEILESEVFQDILEKIREYQSDLVVLVPDGNTSGGQRVAYRIEEEGANIVIKIPMEQGSEYVFSVYGQDDKFIKELEVFWERFKRVYIGIRTQVNGARQYGTEQSRIRNQTKRKK